VTPRPLGSGIDTFRRRCGQLILFGAVLLVPAWAAFAESMSAVTTRNGDAVGRDYGRAGDDEYWEQPEPADFPTAGMQDAYEETKAAAGQVLEEVWEFATQTPAEPSEEQQRFGRQ